MIAYQQHMDVTANNIANSTTAGYKTSRSTFSDLLYTAMDVNTPGEKLTGHGVKNGGPDLVFGQGTLAMTGRSLDYAIVGDGLFALQNAAGERKYTRNGNFGISPQGNKAYLVSNLDGSYVLDNKGKRIELTKNEGTETYDLTGMEEKLGVFYFQNPNGMGRADGSCFTESELSGRAKSAFNDKNAPLYEVRGGTLENSATDLSTEMVNVIQAQRAFQMNSKIVQTADQIEEMVNNLR